MYIKDVLNRRCSIASGYFCLACQDANAKEAGMRNQIIRTYLVSTHLPLGQVADSYFLFFLFLGMPFKALHTVVMSTFSLSANDV